MSAFRLDRFATVVVPELLTLPSAERYAALRRAFAAPLGVVELLVGAFALVGIAWVVRHGAFGFGAAALSLLALAGAAVALRRVRRGLREHMLRRRGHA